MALPTILNLEKKDCRTEICHNTPTHLVATPALQVVQVTVLLVRQLPPPQGFEPIPVCPNFWHSQSSLMPQGAYWFEKDTDWSRADHSAYKSYGQEYHVNVN